MKPQNMMQAMAAIGTFKANHPKFFSFITSVVKPGIPKDTVIEITVTKPGQEPVTTNIKVQESDLELFENLKNGI
mgnify:CR=1 FL=1